MLKMMITQRASCSRLQKTPSFTGRSLACKLTEVNRQGPSGSFQAAEKQRPLGLRVGRGCQNAPRHLSPVLVKENIGAGAQSLKIFSSLKKCL